jgi:hypothetical protein
MKFAEKNFHFLFLVEICIWEELEYQNCDYFVLVSEQKIIKQTSYQICSTMKIAEENYPENFRFQNSESWAKDSGAKISAF